MSVAEREGHSGRHWIVLSRKSPLAQRQTEMAVAALGEQRPDWTFEIRLMSTTGDERLQWSLEQAGGKGLFTSALEQALVAGEGDFAVHSAKDLPTEMEAGVCLAGYLPRADVRDRLVMRADCAHVKRLGTSSPRRRAQLAQRFPDAEWQEIRGNVATRLEKVAQGMVDGTIMAVAGHDRLGIHSWPGLVFEDLAITASVPAPGQGAIGLQCRVADQLVLAPLLCPTTGRSVAWERAVLSALGGGCHSATAVYCCGAELHYYDEKRGYRLFALPDAIGLPDEAPLAAILSELQSANA